MKQDRQKRPTLMSSIFAILLIAIVIIACYTFWHAKGASYLSNDSEACNDYLSAPHSQKIAGQPRATCNDCHLPHNFVSKWIAKAQSGVGHAYAFTFKLDTLPTNLSANETSSKWCKIIVCVVI